jgi:enoyl-CoA hydratase
VAHPEFTTLSITYRGTVAELTLERPELLNRVDELAHAELEEAFALLGRNADLRAVVLAAAGRVFSAGGDFELMLRGNADLGARTQLVDGGRIVLANLLDIPAPVVAALHGDAIGLGATLVLCCDAVVSHPGCRIGDPHVAIGLVAGDGGCLVWPQAAGMLRAKRYLLTGDALNGQEAHQMGLVTDLVEGADDVLPAARALAERLAALPPLAVQGTKRSLNAVLRQRFDEVMPLSLAYELATMGSDDLREAIEAFRERRPPNYRGR